MADSVMDELEGENQSARRNLAQTLQTSGGLGNRAVAPELDFGTIVPPSTPTLGFLGDVVRWGENLLGMRMFVWMLAGFVGMLVGLPTIMAILPVLGFANRPAAQLVAATNCRWTDAAAAIPFGGDLRPGQKIDLAAGEIKIAFARGAVLTVRGPSVLEIESAACARLVVGSVSARAESARSHGFTLRLPTASVVDLGTEFHVQTAVDGHSRVDVSVGAVEIRDRLSPRPRRLDAGQAAQFEPGENGVFAMIEGGDESPAFRFPTIEPPSNKDYADASQNHATISVAEGRLDENSGPVECLLDGRGLSSADAFWEGVFFRDGETGKLLLDLGKVVRVQKINTYSWHESANYPRTPGARHTSRAPQRYTLYGFAGDSPPPVKGDPAAHGWTRICRIDTDEYFSVPPVLHRPAQQAVSIGGANREVARCRFLLWAPLATPTEDTPGDKWNANTLFAEFDVYAEE